MPEPSTGFHYNLEARSEGARAGTLRTPHGPVRTPAFWERVGLHAALHPAEGPSHAGASEPFIGGKRSALVEGHDDVGAQGVLDLDGPLGRQLQGGAVDLVAEADPPVAVLR